MTITHTLSHTRNRTAWFGALAAGTLIATAGCSEGLAQRSAGQPAVAAVASGQQPGTPVVVSCEPQQRTFVRPVVINGMAVSQVECVTDAAAAASTAAMTTTAPMPVEYRAPMATAGMTPVRYLPVDSLPDARVVSVSSPVSAPVSVARSIPARQVVYRETRPIKRPRSVKKSAIIIGSSAGAGAGVGAAIGGKKGALIGALVGGGGATLWDQITRRDR